MYINRGEGKIIPPARPMELKKIKELIYKSPEIREDIVADLRTRILEGVYKVKAEQVAEKIIQHSIYILSGLEGNKNCPL